jgi:hypothetical protein
MVPAAYRLGSLDLETRMPFPLARLAALGALALPLAGCISYNDHPAPPPNVVVQPPVQETPSGTVTTPPANAPANTQ